MKAGVMCILKGSSGFGVQRSALNTKHRTRNTEQGLSLIELIMFIVIVSVGIAGILLALEGDRAPRSAGADRLPRFG